MGDKSNEGADQRVVEDRQTLLSVLLELTVAASNLFDPHSSMSNFLERLAERLGCVVVLCIEVTMGEKKEIKLVESIGLSRSSRDTPLSNALLKNEIHMKMGRAVPISLSYKELVSSQLEQWTFTIPIEGTVEDPGAIYYLQLYFNPTEEPKEEYHGMIERLLVILRNALAHRRLYQKTLDQKTLLEVQSECTMEGILIVSLDKKVRFVNQRFIDMWGFKPDLNRELDKTNVSRLLAKVINPKKFLSELDAFEQSKEKKTQSQLTLHDGQVFDCFSVPIRSQNAIYYGRGWYFKDITESKKGERERALLLSREIKAHSEAEVERKKIAKALGIRDDFISIASHELKTPITSLRLQLQLMRLELKKYQSRESYSEPFFQNIARKLNISEQQVERLIILVFGLLDVSKIQAGKLSLEVKEVNLSELLLEIINRFSEQFKAAGSELKVDIDPNVVGCWDPFRIEQVINNLIVNAIKYGDSKLIEIRLTQAHGFACFIIKDHGHGIKKEHQKLIFEKYERISSSSNTTGLGLGLYIAHQIVSHHRGSIQVVSIPGQESTFTVYLPLKAMPLKAMEDAKKSA